MSDSVCGAPADVAGRPLGARWERRGARGGDFVRTTVPVLVLGPREHG
ncbi:MAG: hypothetical protein ABIU87_04770 [Ornithinibacter sp.]